MTDEKFSLSGELKRTERDLFGEQSAKSDITIETMRDLAVGEKRLGHHLQIGENAKRTLKRYGNADKVADSVTSMLISDYLETRKGIDTRQSITSKPKIVGCRLDYIGSSDRYTFILTTTNLLGKDDKRRLTTTYIFEFHKPEETEFDDVYQARLGNTIFGERNGSYEVIGNFGDQLKESPEARLKKIYDEGGVETFLKNVDPNDCYGFYWNCDNATEGLRNGKIPVDDFIKRGAYIILPYKDNGVKDSILKRIEEGKFTQMGEFWIADFETYSGRE